LMIVKYPCLTTLCLMLILYTGTMYATAPQKSPRINNRDEMRKFVQLISRRAKAIKPGFLIIPQNAPELITVNGEHDGKPVQSYLSAIDGMGCEELFYGEKADGVKTSSSTTDYFLPFLLKLKNRGKAVLVIDYVTSLQQANDSRARSRKYVFLSFQGERSLSKIPLWDLNLHSGNIGELSSAMNFLYLLNASGFRGIDDYLNSLRSTRWDVFIIDAFFWGKLLTREQVQSLQKKPSGRGRLVLAYLSIGEAEEYRYYWRSEWKRRPPQFLERENPEWKGNYKVRYWMDEWQEIICGKADGGLFDKSYLKRIIDAGFDGVYLDILDAAFHFEHRAKYHSD
jgi:cysteinyl-tRNA synthetase